MTCRFTSAVLVRLAVISIVCGQADRLSGETTALSVQPSEIRIDGSNRQQQLVVTAAQSDGSLVDVTHQVNLQLSDPHVAGLTETRVHGIRDGQSLLSVRYDGLESSILVRVDQTDRFPDVHFVNDLVPLFSKLRCNGSGCHGKQTGQNGFKLSVFGSNPRADYEALVNESRGRRISLTTPCRSLLLLKATGAMPHGGGRRTEPESSDSELIRQWVLQGTPWGRDDAPRLVGLHVFPDERVAHTQAKQQLLVTAKYSDGSRRDVTHAAAYTSNAEGVATVDERGRVSTGNSPRRSGNYDQLHGAGWSCQDSCASIRRFQVHVSRSCAADRPTGLGQASKTRPQTVGAC